MLLDARLPLLDWLSEHRSSGLRSLSQLVLSSDEISGGPGWRSLERKQLPTRACETGAPF